MTEVIMKYVKQSNNLDHKKQHVEDFDLFYKDAKCTNQILLDAFGKKMDKSGRGA